MLSSSISFYDKIKIQKGFDFPRPKLENKSRCPGSWIFLGTLSPWESQPWGDCVKGKKAGVRVEGALTPLPAAPAGGQRKQCTLAWPVPCSLRKTCSPVPRTHWASIATPSSAMPGVAPVGSMIMCRFHNLSKLCISTALDDGEDNRWGNGSPGTLL